MLLIRRDRRWLSLTTTSSRLRPSPSSAATCPSSSSAYMRMLVSGVFSSCDTWLTKLTRCDASRSSRVLSRYSHSPIAAIAAPSAHSPATMPNVALPGTGAGPMWPRRQPPSGAASASVTTGWARGAGWNAPHW